MTWWALAWLLLLVRVYSCVLDTEPRAPESARSKELMHLMQESRARRQFMLIAVRLHLEGHRLFELKLCHVNYVNCLDRERCWDDGRETRVRVLG